MGTDKANFGFYFSIGVDAMNATIDATTKVVKIQTGDSTNQTVEADNTEMWCGPGIVSMPAPPTQGGPSCQLIILKRGDIDIVLAARDTRAAAIYGNLKAGETAVFATAGQGRALFKADGSINLYTTVNNQPGGTGMALSITPSTDTISAVNSKGYGFIIDDTGVAITTGTAGLKLGSDGSIKLIGTAQAQIDGTSILLGAFGAPLTNSVLVGSTGPTAVPSTKVFAAITNTT